MNTSHCRYYSPDELRTIAQRIGELVARDRQIWLTPTTGWIVEQAVRAFASRPTCEQIMEIICGKGPCDSG